MAASDQVKEIACLYSAKGTLPVYEICYAGKRIAFYLSRAGAPACIAGLEEIIAFANRAASLTCSRSGAIPAMPTLAEMKEGCV